MTMPELLLETLYEDSPCGMLVTDAAGLIMRANKTFCRWTGFAAAELVDRRTLQSLLTVGGRIFHQTHWAPLLQMQGSVSEVKLDLVHADGSRIPFVMNAQRREWSGQMLHEVAVFVAKDRHKYEQELVKSRRNSEQLLKELKTAATLTEDRARFAEQMMGMVSHDLRNPLAVIKLLARLLSVAPVVSDEKRRETAQRLTRAVQSGERLIGDMLDFTAVRLGRGLSLKPQDIDVHALVAQAAADLAIAYPGRVLEHQAEGVGAARVDPERITQLLGNLVSNAMAYGARDRPILVRTSSRDGEAVIQVENAGDPIPAELLPTMFEPMTRGRAESSNRSIGLGLFIVSQIARAHSGRVAVQSDATRTTFSVFFPTSPRPPEASQESQAVRPE